MPFLSKFSINFPTKTTHFAISCVGSLRSPWPIDSGSRLPKSPYAPFCLNILDFSLKIFFQTISPSVLDRNEPGTSLLVLTSGLQFFSWILLFLADFGSMGGCLPCLGGQEDDYNQPSPVSSKIMQWFDLQVAKTHITLSCLCCNCQNLTAVSCPN